MGVPGGQELEEGNCPLCGEVVARFMTDGFISVKLTKEQHRLLQTIFNASRTHHPCPQHIVEAAANLIKAGYILQVGSDLIVTNEVQQALASIGQPLKL